MWVARWARAPLRCAPTPASTTKRIRCVYVYMHVYIYICMWVYMHVCVCVCCSFSILLFCVSLCFFPSCNTCVYVYLTHTLTHTSLCRWWLSWRKPWPWRLRCAIWTTSPRPHPSPTLSLSRSQKTCPSVRFRIYTCVHMYYVCTVYIYVIEYVAFIYLNQQDD